MEDGFQHNPKLNAMLKAIGLDVFYHKGRGNTLYYYNRQQIEVAVSDFLGGYGSCLFGHNHPRLIAVAGQCLENYIPFFTQASYRQSANKLAQAIQRILNEHFNVNYKTVFGSTGAEAVEIALKHAAFCYFNKSQSRSIQWLNIVDKEVFLDDKTAQFLGLQEGGKIVFKLPFLEKVKAHNHSILHKTPMVLASEGAFHGKTNAALSVTYNDFYKVSPMPEISGVRYVAHEVDALSALFNELECFIFEPRFINQQWHIKHKTHLPVSCVILEPLQGEGGIISLPSEVTQAWQVACTARQIPIIVDEIQCGMGRTGTFFYSTALGLKPDYLLLSKSLGGGMAKISACCISDDFYLEDMSLKHSSTFAEDEWSCRIALEAISLAEDPDVTNVIVVMGSHLKNELNEVMHLYPQIISDIRGAGLMLGVEFNKNLEFQSNMLRYLQQHGLLGYAMAAFLLHNFNIRVAPTLGKNNVIRIAPSYLVSDEEINRLKLGLIELCDILRVSRADKLMLPRKFWEHIPVVNLPIMNNQKDTPFGSIPKVGFVGHYVTASDIGWWDPCFAGQSDEVFQHMLKTFEPICAPFKGAEIKVKTPEGEVLFMFIGLPYSSEQIYSSIKSRQYETMREMVHAAVDFAIQEGCRAVGLGGYTSILTRNGKTVEHKPINITTGNSFTVGSALAALRNQADNLGIVLSTSTLAVVGAGGNIGSVVAMLMSSEVQRLILIGSPGRLDSLTVLMNELCNLPECKAEIEVTDDLFILKEADLITSATNAALPIIMPEMIADKPVIICDISVPGDLHPEVELHKPNAQIIKGGVISLSATPDFYVPGIPLPHGHVFACMAETMLMGLENLDGHFSIGNISADQVKRITNLAQKHGFYEVVAKMKRSY